MVVGVENQPVVAENNALGVSFAAFVIDVALEILAFVCLRELSFVVAETVAAYALAGRNFLEVAEGVVPAEFLGFCLGDVIVWQFSQLGRSNQSAE